MPEIPNLPERHLIYVVSDEAENFRAIKERLNDTFRVLLAKTESEIKEAFEQSEVNAVLFNLDCVEDSTADGLEVLEEMRKVRDDIILAAFTRSTQRTLPHTANQAGADEFFVLPLNFEELKIVLLRAIEKRALELEGRRVIQ
ncbi:MAG TPA: response regulator, partial [Candidatus Acidoferrum sp.]